MFEIYGEFDSAEEINMKAESLFNEGDHDGIRALAKENGIPEEFAEAYISGDLPELTDISTAGIGKIDIELPDTVKVYATTAEAVAEYIKSLCDRDPFAAAVRRKEKSLTACIRQLEAKAESQVKKREGTKAVCIPPSEGFKMIRNYYTNETKGKGAAGYET